MNKIKGSIPIRIFLISNIFAALLSLCMLHSVLAFDSPGVTLSIHAEPGVGGKLVYALEQDPIPFHVVLNFDRNISVATERDFPKIELHHTLIVTDPNNVKHVLRPSDHDHKMPPPKFIRSIPYSPAQAIAPGWVKSTMIDDLRNLVPEMYALAGWYTIVAEQPYVRFAKIKNFGGSLGTVGVQGDAGNWTGALVSNTLEVYIKPPGGARIEVVILDDSATPPGKLFHVPIRLFRDADVPAESDPQEIWSTIPYVMEKYSDNDGMAVLANASGCLSQDDYLIIAKYAEDFKESDVDYEDGGWVAEGCDSVISRQFGFAPPPETIPGDLDGDGDIDAADYSTFRSTLRKCTGDSGFIPDADYDGDGCVTFADYRIWYGYFKNQ